MNNEYKEELGAMMRQVSVSAQEIHRTIISEEKNIEIINHNLNEAALELKELSDDAGDNADLAEKAYNYTDEKLNSIQESAMQSMVMARKAEKQKPMFEALEKLISTVIESLQELKDDILEPMHVLSVNGAIHAGRARLYDSNVAQVLQTVSAMTNELTDKSTDKINSLVKELSPYIETAQRLAVANDEFFVAAKNAASQMGKAFDMVQEIRMCADENVSMVKSLKKRADKASINLNVIAGHVAEFSGSVTQTTEAMSEMEKAFEEINSTYHKEDSNVA